MLKTHHPFMPLTGRDSWLPGVRYGSPHLHLLTNCLPSKLGDYIVSLVLLRKQSRGKFCCCIQAGHPLSLSKFFAGRRLLAKWRRTGAISLSRSLHFEPLEDRRMLALASDLDLSFGGTGKVTTAFSIGNAAASNMVRQTDGKIVVVGTGSNGTTDDILLARYNVDGSLDTAFSGDGKVITDSGLNEKGSSVALQSDGKIVVAGYHFDGTQEVFAVWRYNANGSLDTSFSGDGKATTSFFAAGFPCEATTVAVQSNDKIVVGGFAASGSNTPMPWLGSIQTVRSTRPSAATAKLLWHSVLPRHLQTRCRFKPTAKLSLRGLSPSAALPILA